MKKRKKSSTPPPVVTKVQRKSAMVLLAFLGSCLLIAVLFVGYAKMNEADAGWREYIDSLFETDDIDTPVVDSGIPGEVMAMLELLRPELVTAEEAATLEDLFNEETQAIHDDLIEDAEFHSDQIDCLIKAVYFEAAKEPALGKRWIFDVINNRVKQQYRGMQTYCDVIYDHKQFSFANLTRDLVPDNNRFLIESRNIVLELYGNPNHRDITCGATHYLNVAIATDLSWYEQALDGTSPEGLTVLAKVGNHTFLGPEDGCN